jgi:hypothetical protein
MPFANLKPTSELGVAIIQSEDSPRRITIDRDDVTAELSEQFPDIDWLATWQKVSFYKFPGMTGAEFLKGLDAYLESMREEHKPDIIIINPLLAFIGGPITDGAYVTPFLRGGTINRVETNGLQYILERHMAGALIFHHTPKPPSDNELAAWMKSRFPEYQGAGSSDITNWGRSFITMMRVKDYPDRVCLTAGKNGSGLEWDIIGGAYRHYMAWSRGKGVTGGNRHAWRELDADELADITKETRAAEEADALTLAEMLLAEPMTRDQMSKRHKMTQRRFNAAWKKLTADFEKYGLAKREIITGNGKPVFYGRPGEVDAAAETALRNFQNSPAGTSGK